MVRGVVEVALAYGLLAARSQASLGAGGAPASVRKGTGKLLIVPIVFVSYEDNSLLAPAYERIQMDFDITLLSLWSFKIH